MKVFIRLKDIGNKLVTIAIQTKVSSGTVLSFPIWRPGRYEPANYMANISNINLVLNNTLIQPAFHSVSEMELPFFEGEQELQVHFTVFCNEINAGSSYIDNDQWYFNFINFIPCIKGMELEPVIVEVDFPKEFDFYSALKKKGNTLLADSYFELVDAPFLASRYLEFQTFEIDETVFQLAINNTEQVTLPWEKLVKDFKQFAIPQRELFGSFPFTEFTYLIQLLPYKTYHGVEHKNCTVITLGPTEKAIYGDWYSELLGVSSHELFHCWNVTRLRPQEMMPYDFSKQQIHSTGFVTEGFTTYYGDLMLVRGGVFSLEDYFKEVNGYLKRYLENPAYKSNTMVEASVSLWANGYKAGPPFNHVSIYIKGALLALLLDLQLRKEGSSLDELMRLLWRSYLENGYRYEDVIDAINQLQSGLGDLFSTEYYMGLKDVISALEIELESVGVDLVYENHPNELTHKWGVLLSVNQVVTYIEPKSPLIQRLCVGDEVVEFSSSEVKIKRMGIEKQIDIVRITSENSFFSMPSLKLSDSLSNLQKEKLKNWLKTGY